MGLLGDFKRLLFGASSVAKSTADQGMEAGKRTARLAGETLSNNADALFDTARTTADDLSKQAAEEAGQAWAKTKDFVEDLGEKVSAHPAGQRAMNTAENVGKQVKEAATPLVDKAADLSEQVGKAVLEEGGKAAEKLGDVAEQVGGAAMTVGGTLAGRLKHVADDLGAKGKTVFDEAQRAAAEEAATAKAGADDVFDDIARQANAASADVGEAMDDLTAKANAMGSDATTRADKLSTSELADKDDFFTKANRYAEGDYDMDGKIDGRPTDTAVPGTITIGENPDYVKPEPTGTIAGFEDLDGDGDELIDDAIIDEVIDGAPPALEAPDDGDTEK